MDDVDTISPSLIEHRIDEIRDAGVLLQRYNFLDYHFEEMGAYCRARTYLDKPNEVTLFGPFERKGSIRQVACPELEEAVLAFLQRRFHEVKRLADYHAG